MCLVPELFITQAFIEIPDKNSSIRAFLSSHLCTVVRIPTVCSKSVRTPFKPTKAKAIWQHGSHLQFQMCSGTIPLN